VDRADRVADRALGVAAALQSLVNRDLDVTEVIQSVENAQDVDAILDRVADEQPDHLIRVMTVAEDVLAPKQHLELGVGNVFFDQAQALPWIFVQETQAGVKRRAAPALD